MVATTFHQTFVGRAWRQVPSIVKAPSAFRTFSLPASFTRFVGSVPAHTAAVVVPQPSAASRAVIVAVWCDIVAVDEGFRTEPPSVSKGSGIVAS